MARRRGRGSTRREPPPWELGWLAVRRHPLFGPVAQVLYSRQVAALPPDGWAVVGPAGIRYDPDRGGSPDEWAWVFAHCVLQVGFGHLPLRAPAVLWVAAADLVCEQFLASLKFGRRPRQLPALGDVVARDAETLFARLQIEGLPQHLAGRGTAGQHRLDLVETTDRWVDVDRVLGEAQRALGIGLATAVRRAVEVGGGHAASLQGERKTSTAQRARSWFVSAYPLLGALAAAFEVVEDLQAAHTLDISVAAVDPEQERIYINPAAGLDDDTMRFVMAHELLHAGLRHDARQQGRDPFLWNVACDYVINDWLIQMEIGRMPDHALHDASLRDLGAEQVYDRLIGDMRRLKRLATFRGTGACDLLPAHVRGWWRGRGCDLDAFYRRALATGLQLHTDGQRGLIPAGLVQEIRALSHPAIPWEVELAQWFDRFFTPVARRRTYARPSRRQASTPDIPRPRWVLADDALDGRTFGVVLDTSGSMGTELLGRALGAVASYAASRDVPAARVVFCDAAAYDAGYLAPDAIADRVRVRGRGGTVLQPGVDLIHRATDFPRRGPILVITDAECDVLRIRREHAFLIPAGKRLPFSAVGPVFRFA